MSLTLCQDVVEVLSDHLDGALDAPAERDVLLHLRGCDGCTTYLGQLRATVQALRLLGGPERMTVGAADLPPVGAAA